MSIQLPTHDDIITKLVRIHGLSTLIAMAGLGEDCTTSKSNVDYHNVGVILGDLLLDVCGDLETLKARYEGGIA